MVNNIAARLEVGNNRAEISVRSGTNQNLIAPATNALGGSYAVVNNRNAATAAAWDMTVGDAPAVFLRAVPVHTNAQRARILGSDAIRAAFDTARMGSALGMGNLSIPRPPPMIESPTSAPTTAPPPVPASQTPTTQPAEPHCPWCWRTTQNTCNYSSAIHEDGFELEVTASSAV